MGQFFILSVAWKYLLASSISFGFKCCKIFDNAKNSVHIRNLAHFCKTSKYPYGSLGRLFQESSLDCLLLVSSLRAVE